MAIYKLGNVCSMKKGKGKFYKRHLNKNSDVLAYHYGELYKKNLLDYWETTVGEEFVRNDNFVDVNEVMIIAVSESFDEIGHVIYNNYERGLIGNDIIHLYNFVDVLPKWLFYFLQSNQISFRQLAYGDKVAHLKISDLETLEINNLPPLKDQQEIIDIIKPLELQLRTLENIKKHLYLMLDNLEIEESTDYVDFKDIQTGKRNAIHETSNGKFNFYTCGEKIKKCDEYSFDGKYILLSGNANLYTWWYEGKFDLYQRVYALKPMSDFFTSFHSVRLGMEKLRNKSAGSVIKYIKLNDIKTIRMYDNSHEEELKDLYTSIYWCDKNLNELEIIKEKLIKLLIK